MTHYDLHHVTEFSATVKFLSPQTLLVPRKVCPALRGLGTLRALWPQFLRLGDSLQLRPDRLRDWALRVQGWGLPHFSSIFAL